MKCKSFVKFVPAKRKGSREPYQKAVKVFPRYFIKLGRFTPEPGMVECDGDIEINVEASMEGGCACSSYSVLRLNYKCKKCGNTYFEELPQDEKELSYLLQAFFEELSEALRDKMIDFRVSKELEFQKEVEKRTEETRKFIETKKKKNKDVKI